MRERSERAWSVEGVAPRLPPGHVRRDRLIRLLDSHAELPLIVVQGPAGAGKTSLVADWVQYRAPAERFAWVTLDRTVRTPDELWGEIAVELFGDPDLPRMGHARIAALLHRQGQSVNIVIDDFHLASPEIARDVARLSQLLAGGRVVVLTRRISDAEAALQGVQTGVATITAEQLSYSVQEISELIAAHNFPSEDGTEVDPAQWHELTGGHPLLTRLALTNRGGVDADNVGRLAADWAAGLVRPGMLEFALITSHLPVINTELAVEVTGQARAGRMLAELVRDGLGSEDHNGYFTYHELIGSALRFHAGSALPPETRQRACSIAATYLSNRPGHTVAAFRLLAEAGRTTELWPYAAMNFAALMSEPAAVKSVLGGLPNDVVAADGTLGAMAAMIRSLRESSPSVGLLDTAATALEELQARPDTENQEEAYLREAAILGLLRATRRYDDAAAYADRLEKMASELDPSTRLRLRPARHSALLGAATTHTLAGNLYDAERILTSLESDDREHGSHRRHVQQAFIRAMRGEVTAASAIIDAYIDRAPHAPVWAERFAITQAAILLERGQAHAAREALKAIEPNLAVLEDWPYALVVAARTHIVIDPRVGIEDIDRLLRLHGKRPVAPGVRDLLDSAVADLALAAGDVQRATRMVVRRNERDIALRLTAARIGLISGDNESVDDLRRLVRQDEVWPRLRAQALLLLAIHLYRAGSHESAHDLLKRSLAITREHGIRLIHSLIPRSELESIAAGAGIELPSNVNATNPLEETLTPAGLTKREEALLKRLATTATLREIAASEFVTLSTIKSQAASIYRKLGIGSRLEAVEVARRKGILA